MYSKAKLWVWDRSFLRPLPTLKLHGSDWKNCCVLFLGTKPLYQNGSSIWFINLSIHLFTIHLLITCCESGMVLGIDVLRMHVETLPGEFRSPLDIETNKQTKNDNTGLKYYSTSLKRVLWEKRWGSMKFLWGARKRIPQQGWEVVICTLGFEEWWGVGLENGGGTPNQAGKIGNSQLGDTCGE